MHASLASAAEARRLRSFLGIGEASGHWSARFYLPPEFLRTATGSCQKPICRAAWRGRFYRQRGSPLLYRAPSRELGLLDEARFAPPQRVARRRNKNPGGGA